MTLFFDKVKHGFSKGMTTVSIRSKELLDTNRLNSQIAECERQKREAQAELGKTVCGMLEAGSVDVNALKEAHTAIGRFDVRLDEVHRELARVHAEAQQALQMGEQTVSSAISTMHCTSCGVAIAGDAKFCGGCGRPQKA
jgi:hypothetical protein